MHPAKQSVTMLAIQEVKHFCNGCRYLCTVANSIRQRHFDMVNLIFHYTNLLSLVCSLMLSSNRDVPTETRRFCWNPF